MKEIHTDEIERLRDRIASRRKLQAKLGDYYLQLVNRAHLTAELNRLKQLEGEKNSPNSKTSPPASP